MTTNDSISTDESLYNQNVTEDDIYDAIRTDDTEDVYSDYEDGEIILHDDAINRIRDQLATLEEANMAIWDIFAEEWADFESSNDGYLVGHNPIRHEEAADGLEAVGDYDNARGSNEIDVDVLVLLVGKIARKLRPSEDARSDWVVPLPEGETLDDAREYRT